MANQSIENNAGTSSTGFSRSDTYVAQFDSTFGWEHLDKEINSIFGRAIARSYDVSVNGYRNGILPVRSTKRLRESRSMGVRS